MGIRRAARRGIRARLVGRVRGQRVYTPLRRVCRLVGLKKPEQVLDVAGRGRGSGWWIGQAEFKALGKAPGASRGRPWERMRPKGEKRGGEEGYVTYWF